MREFFGVRRQMLRLRETSMQEPRPDLESKLLIAFRRQTRLRRRRRLIVGLAVAAVLLSVGAVLTTTHASRVSVSRENPFVSATPIRPRFTPSPYDTADFVPLPYAESGVPLEGAIVVRVDIPESQIGSITRRFHRASKGQNTVEADLLIGQDGVPRAVRVLK